MRETGSAGAVGSRGEHGAARHGLILVPIADMTAVRGSESDLVTRGVSSSVAVAVCDAEERVAGLLHFILPNSAVDPGRAALKPCIFADTGIARLLSEVERLGARRARLKAWIAGGAALIGAAGILDGGQMNARLARAILDLSGVQVVGEATGGRVSRRLRFSIREEACYVSENEGPEARI